MGKLPLCSETKRNGDPCNSYARESGLCGFHERQAAQAAEADLQPDVELEPETLPATGEDSPNGERPRLRVLPGQLRAQIADDLGAAYGDLIGALFMAAQADKDAYTTCPGCGKRHVARVGDWTARTAALKLLLEQGIGRPQEKQPEPPEIHGKPLHDMTDDELHAVIREYDATEQRLRNAKEGMDGHLTAEEMEQVAAIYDRARLRYQASEPLTAA